MMKKILACLMLTVTFFTGCFSKNQTPEEILLEQETKAKEIRNNGALEEKDWKFVTINGDERTEVFKDGNNYLMVTKYYQNGLLTFEGKKWLIKEDNKYLYFEGEDGTYYEMELSNEEHLFHLENLTRFFGVITSMQNAIANIVDTCQEYTCEVEKDKKTNKVSISFEIDGAIRLIVKEGYLLSYEIESEDEFSVLTAEYVDQTIELPNKEDYELVSVPGFEE